MRLIDPTKTDISRRPTEHGYVAMREHWNGSVDATVRVKALRLSVVADAPPSKMLVAAVAELEAAQAEWMIAKNSRSDEWKRYVQRRLHTANERLREVQ